MPKYFVYDKSDGRVVQVHETYDITSGTTLPCTEAEVLAVVTADLDRDRLGILESEFEPRAGSGPLRVDVEAGRVMAGE